MEKSGTIYSFISIGRGHASLLTHFFKGYFQSPPFYKLLPHIQSWNTPTMQLT